MSMLDLLVSRQEHLPYFQGDSIRSLMMPSTSGRKRYGERYLVAKIPLGIFFLRGRDI